MRYDYKLMNSEDFAYDQLLDFLKNVEIDFTIPLSRKIDLELFLSKIKNNGLVYCAYDNKKLIGACFFYCNDTQIKKAYLSVLCVSKKYFAHFSRIFGSLISSFLILEINFPFVLSS